MLQNGCLRYEKGKSISSVAFGMQYTNYRTWEPYHFSFSQCSYENISRDIAGTISSNNVKAAGWREKRLPFPSLPLPFPLFRYWSLYLAMKGKFTFAEYTKSAVKLLKQLEKLGENHHLQRMFIRIGKQWPSFSEWQWMVTWHVTMVAKN